MNQGEPVKRHLSALATAAALVAVPMSIAPIIAAPTAAADICAGVHGRFVGVGGCGAPVQRIAGAAIAGAAIAAADTPYVWGEQPCYTVEGTPYYTPPGAPC